MSADEFHEAKHVTVKVGVEHLKFWFAAPEPVYLVVYVEAVDTFVGVDVRELVEREWGQTFYASMRAPGATGWTRADRSSRTLRTSVG